MVASRDRKVIGTILLCLVLTLSLLVPAFLTPQTTKAQDADTYVLVQIPGLEKAAALKATVEKVLYCNGTYAIVACSEEQLTALQDDGYVINDNCAGSQDECLAQLSETLKSAPRLQTAAMRGGPDNFGYQFTDSREGNVCYNWIEIANTRTNTGINCDDCGVTVPIGFTFPFYGNGYSTVSISSNGYLTFNGIGYTWVFWSDPIPYSEPPNNIICPFRDDLYSRCEGSAIYYDTRLIGTERAFIVEWVGNQFCCGCPQPYRLTFEAILYPDGNILFQYLDMSGPDRVDGSNASIGIENIDGTVGLQYSYESPTISNGLAILFYLPPLPPNFNCPNIAQNRLKVSPTMPANLNPPQMSLQYLNITPQETSANQPVTISTNVANTGDQAGNYNVVLKINGQSEESRMVSVGPLTSQPVKFTVTRSQPGTYSVDIGIQQGSFIVLGNGKTEGTPVNSGLIAMLAFGIVAVIIVLMIVLRRPA